MVQSKGQENHVLPLREVLPMGRLWGIGTDIIECERVARMIQEHGDLFLTRVYTPREIEYCQRRRYAQEHFAARWAAKEAVLKAIGTGWRKGIAFTDIEIRHAPSGRPTVALRGYLKRVARKRGITRIVISISHCRKFATAMAIAIRRS